mmetsp:Transcript_9000/g.18447  ORF Transcript_9000/g.18447 Transcript_9000/m.18447 type:complete len:209 (-) Transcript_9000:90-716(-)
MRRFGVHEQGVMTGLPVSDTFVPGGDSRNVFGRTNRDRNGRQGSYDLMWVMWFSCAALRAQAQQISDSLRRAPPRLRGSPEHLVLPVESRRPLPGSRHPLPGAARRLSDLSSAADSHCRQPYPADYGQEDSTEDNGPGDSPDRCGAAHGARPVNVFLCFRHSRGGCRVRILGQLRARAAAVRGRVRVLGPCRGGRRRRVGGKGSVLRI